jgi:hypothetical protein
MKFRRTNRPLKTLDFDCETVAAGFADPNWVPQKITCIAWSWIGSDLVRTKTCGGSAGLYERPELRAKMLGEFLEDFSQAEMVTGHNLLRFDLGVVNSECMRLGFPPLKSILVQDTMKIVKTKGFKKGQDNLAKLIQTYESKQAMSWQEWEDAYAVPGWPLVVSRARSDVIMHKEMRLGMGERGWLKPAQMWRP